MENIKRYVKKMCEKCYATKDDLNDDFGNDNFEYFLTFNAEKYYKNEQMLTFFKDINDHIDDVDVTKDELINSLEATKTRCVEVRLKNNPVNFSTNQILNLIRLWEFEINAEKIKQIDILLSKI